MDPKFMMGSLGTVTGERITRLFEKQRKQICQSFYTAQVAVRGCKKAFIR
ncbi:hypothetical protein AAULR_16984 [Lacticaseibacillus rhamnosus MTCC 5462]|nr:hypothetical protein AAULR_16984 [Lacticaseibacillus rhamnosus MTCC 5462]